MIGCRMAGRKATLLARAMAPQSMIPESVQRFLEKIMLKQEADAAKFTPAWNAGCPTEFSRSERIKAARRLDGQIGHAPHRSALC